MAPGQIFLWLFFVLFLLLQIVLSNVIDPASLQYIARHLLQNECQRIVSEPFSIIPPPSYEIDCFRNLVDWESNLRVNRRDIILILRNRLRKIGRDDLAALLAGPYSNGKSVSKETVEYESWDDARKRKFVSSSGPPMLKKDGPMSPEYRQQLIRKLKGIHNLDGFKDRSLAMVEPESEHSETLGGDYATAESAPKHHQSHGDISEPSVTTPKENEVKDSNPKPVQNSSLKSSAESEKHDKSKLPKFLSRLTDEKTAPCLRVPLSTALVVIGTIMTLTCCCALLLRNRLAACFERLRGHKNNNKNKTSKRLSLDEEQGFMGPRTVGKTPKRSGRKGGGPIDVTNVGIQNSNTASNGSIESDEKPTGCCTCCTKKKKSNRRKRKK